VARDDLPAARPDPSGALRRVESADLKGGWPNRPVRLDHGDGTRIEAVDPGLEPTAVEPAFGPAFRYAANAMIMLAAVH